VLVLARSDHEVIADRQLPTGVDVDDWAAPRLGRRGRLLERLGRSVDRRPGRSDQISALLAAVSTWSWSRVAGEHMRMGTDLLCSARVVVTDRLHAHVLCLLLGIPNVITDNVSGKVRAFYETWTRESPLVTWADSLEQGVTLARDRIAAAY
jgi:pyruvyl transferase EpsO